jgi:hypothetical protein
VPIAEVIQHQDVMMIMHGKLKNKVAFACVAYFKTPSMHLPAEAK